jgi:hypothetical protein
MPAPETSQEWRELILHNLSLTSKKRPLVLTDAMELSTI